MVLITEFLRYFVKADSLTELSVAFLAILSPITAKYSLKCCDISIGSSIQCCYQFVISWGTMLFS